MFQSFNVNRWTRGSTLIAEPDAIPDDALRLAVNVRLDRTLGAIEARPGWSAKTAGTIGAAISYVSRLFSTLGTYTYAQAGTLLLRLGPGYGILATIATPGSQTVSDANSPDGNGHLLKYFVNGAIAVKDDGVTTTTMGIAPPTAAPLSATLAPDLFTQIDYMDVAASWAGTNLTSGPVDDTALWNGPFTDATTVIGSGANGTITLTALNAGFLGNTYTATVVVSGGLNDPMSAALVGVALTVTLGTDGAGAPDPAKNTATLIAAAVNATTGVTAVASGTGVTPLTGAEGPHTMTGGRGRQSVGFTIAASTTGSIAEFNGSGINLDTLTGGDNDVKQDDYIHFWVRVDHPERVTFMQVDIDVDASTTSTADAFRHNYYSIRLGSLETISQGFNEWTELQIRKARFARYGSDTTRSWANAVAFRIGFVTNSLGTIAVNIDDFKLRGGVGIEGDIAYTVTYRNSTTMARGNPPKDADFLVLYTAEVTTDRQRILLTTSSVIQGGANHPGDTQIDRLMIYRKGGIFPTAVLVEEIPDGTASPYLDNTSDSTLVLSPILLETDNDLPPTGTTRVLFGPDASGHFFMLVDGFRLYISKPYEDKENRVENWPRLGFAVASDGSVQAMSGATNATQTRVWTNNYTENVVGVGQDAFLPVTLDGTRGIVGQFAWASGDGVFFFVSQDGIWSDTGGRQQKLTGALDPFFQGRTVDGQLGWNKDQMSQVRLAFLHEPTGSLLCMLYVEAGSSTLNRFLVFKPNFETGQLTEAFFGVSRRTNLTCLYSDLVNLELLAGAADGFIYRIEDPTALGDVNQPIDIKWRLKSYDFGQPQHSKLFASFVAEGTTGGLLFSLDAYYERGVLAQTIGIVQTALETGLQLLPCPTPEDFRRDVALEMRGTIDRRIAITRLGCLYEPQPELLTYLDSGILSFDFTQQVKFLETDINLPVQSTLILYAEGSEIFRRTFAPTPGRVNQPYPLPAGLKGRAWRLTLLSDGAPFRCYKIAGFFKTLGTNQSYTERVMVQGV